MKIQKEIDKINSAIISDLLSGKYKLVKLGEYYGDLVFGENTIRVWIANGVSCCAISMPDVSLTLPNLSDDERKAIFKLATTKSKHYLKNSAKDLRGKMKEKRLIIAEERKQLASLRKKLAHEKSALVALEESEQDQFDNKECLPAQH